MYNPFRIFRPRYKHFESIEGEFYNSLTKYRLLSSNGFAVNLDAIPQEQDFRISRFVRDPRDMIISGYFYHLKGAEPWFRFKSPNSKYWEPINGHIPPEMPKGMSYSEYLQSLSMEQGLIAEIKFRKYHLDSIRHWQNDDRIRIFRYEEILGNEAYMFNELFKFYQVTNTERKVGTWLAEKNALKTGNISVHVRNAKPGQWREYFTSRVENYFNANYEDVLELLNYPI